MQVSKHTIFLLTSNPTKTKLSVKSAESVSNTQDFTYSVGAMKLALDSPRISVPDEALLSDEAFEQWLST